MKNYGTAAFQKETAQINAELAVQPAKCGGKKAQRYHALGLF